MGLSRGRSLAVDLAKIENVSVSWVCDVDQTRLSSCHNQLKEMGSEPRTTKDFRDILSDANVDALVCSAPNHWHGPATIMACKAGKHVYVEKPCSHNPREGELMVEAAKKYGRCVQMGTQRRSSASIQQAIRDLHDGKIGDVLSARCYYTNLRPSIGKGTIKEAPNTLQYDLWQGPAPRKPYRDNVVHYNWHWFWHYGGGELANNGVHALDLCRWGLGVDYPQQVISSGGRYWHDDDQETPDTQTACFEFEVGKRITWQANSCNKHGVNPFCEFFGTNGALALESDGAYYRYDRNDKLVDQQAASGAGQSEHLLNFVEAIRRDDPGHLNQPILEGHKSTLLCHLGNIAFRTSGAVQTSSSDGHLLDSQIAQKHWARDYDPAWQADVTEI